MRNTASTMDGTGPVSRSNRGQRRGSLCALALLLPFAALPAVASGAAGASMAHGPDPQVRISLDEIGFQQLSTDFLLAGSPMLTVDFVDQDHLLVTFETRKLLKREVNPPPGDDDRMIEAVLLGLENGKVLARTEWRTHDRFRYLWSLGDGRFLLRVRDRLTMIAPMQAGPEHAFEETPFLSFDRHIQAVLVSADSDLLTVETTKPPLADGAAVANVSLGPPDPAPVMVNFYRLKQDDAAKRLMITGAGTVRTREPVALPLTTAGILNVQDAGKGTWYFDFHEHAGKVNELLAFDTSCFPRATFVGHSEFVVFGCRGSNDRQEIAGFNLKGDEMWQQNFFESYVAPTFAFAPSAGRFALGRTIVTPGMDALAQLPSAAVTGQEVRVYQTYSGKLLFHIDCSPVERAGQNFALSPDGMRLAAIRQEMVKHPATKYSEAYTAPATAVEVYALPPLSDNDRAALKQVQAMAPADVGVRIDEALMRLSKKLEQKPEGKPQTHAAALQVTPAPEATPAPLKAGTASDAANQSTAAEGNPSTTPSAEPVAEGDVQQEGPRKPPTLYGPDEKPEQPQNHKSK